MLLDTLTRSKCTISAVVTRADGTVEDLGVIHYSHRNPIIHYAVNAYLKLKRYFPK